MDPLSDVLSLLKPENYMSGGIDAGGDWSINFPRYDVFRCFIVISGQCWLSVEDGSSPLQLLEGDCILLPKSLPFTLASDLSLPSIDLKQFLKAPLSGGIATYNGGGSCLGVSSLFTLTGKQADILIDLLPPVVHIRKEADKAAMRWSVEYMMRELREPQPGGTLIAQQLSYMLLVQALRLFLADDSRQGVGWLYALADKQLNAAITSIHQNPAYRWTLPELAKRAGMSRSIFAERFKAAVGTSPMGYVTEWRMRLAADRLTETDETVSTIALSLGYESQSAFRKAFKGVMGTSPREYVGSAFEASLQGNKFEAASGKVE